MFVAIFSNGLDVHWTAISAAIHSVEGEIRTDHAAIEVLHPTAFGNVAGDPKVQKEIVDVGVLIWLEATYDSEAYTFVYGLGDFVQMVPEGGKREGGLVNVVETEIARESYW